MNDQALHNIEQMDAIKRKLYAREISYDEAKAQAQPIIDAIYEQHKAIAKKYNKRATKLSFASIIR